MEEFDSFEFDNIDTSTEGFIDTVKEAVKKMIEWIKKIIKQIKDWIVGLWSKKREEEVKETNDSLDELRNKLHKFTDTELYKMFNTAIDNLNIKDEILAHGKKLQELCYFNSVNIGVIEVFAGDLIECLGEYIESLPRIHTSLADKLGIVKAEIKYADPNFPLREKAVISDYPGGSNFVFERYTENIEKYVDIPPDPGPRHNPKHFKHYVYKIVSPEHALRINRGRKLTKGEFMWEPYIEIIAFISKDSKRKFIDDTPLINIPVSTPQDVAGLCDTVMKDKRTSSLVTVASDTLSLLEKMTNECEKLTTDSSYVLEEIKDLLTDINTLTTATKYALGTYDTLITGVLGISECYIKVFREMIKDVKTSK